MRFKNAFAAAIAVAVSAVVFSAAFQPAEAATTTYTGTFGTPATINAGDTALLNNGATVTGAGVITTNGTLQVDQTATTLTFGNTIAGTGTFSLTNSGTVNLTGGPRILDLTTSVSAGLLTIGNVSGSGDLRVGTSGTGSLNVSGGGRVSNRQAILGNGAGSFGSATVSSGTWANTGTLIVGGSGAGTLTVNGGSVTSNYGAVGDYNGIGLATVSSGTWGVTTTLSIGGFGSGTGTLNVIGGYVSNLDATIGGSLGSVGSGTVSSGTWFNAGSLTLGPNGKLTIDGGLVSVASQLSSPNSNPINLNANGTLKMTGTMAPSTILRANLVNNGALILDSVNTTAGRIYSPVTISGTGSVTKQGVGKWTIEVGGSNSYTGPTNVDAGKLIVDGLLCNTAVTVNAGGFLGGSGTILGNITVGSSGTISPVDGPNDPANFTVGSLSLTTNSYTVMDITGTTPFGFQYDQLVGSGTAAALAYGGNLDLVLSGSYATGTTWNLFSNFLTKTGDLADVVVTAPGDEYDGLTFTNASGVWTSTMTLNGQYLEFTQSTGNLVVVPEPSTIAMTLAGLACGGWQVARRRRRLRK